MQMSRLFPDGLVLLLHKLIQEDGDQLPVLALCNRGKASHHAPQLIAVVDPVHALAGIRVADPLTAFNRCQLITHIRGSVAQLPPKGRPECIPRHSVAIAGN